MQAALLLFNNYLKKLIRENNGSLEYVDKSANTTIVIFLNNKKITVREFQVFTPSSFVIVSVGPIRRSFLVFFSSAFKRKILWLGIECVL